MQMRNGAEAGMQVVASSSEEIKGSRVSSQMNGGMTNTHKDMKIEPKDDSSR